jgi:hypothetical protein
MLSSTQFPHHQPLRTFIQRVVRVGLVEQVDETVDDRVDIQHGFPILAQDVQTDVAVEVDVRVVDLQTSASKTYPLESTPALSMSSKSQTHLRQTVNLGRVMRVHLHRPQKHITLAHLLTTAVLSSPVFHIAHVRQGS